MLSATAKQHTLTYTPLVYRNNECHSRCKWTYGRTRPRWDDTSLCLEWHTLGWDLSTTSIRNVMPGHAFHILHIHITFSKDVFRSRVGKNQESEDEPPMLRAYYTTPPQPPPSDPPGLLRFVVFWAQEECSAAVLGVGNKNLGGKLSWFLRYSVPRADMTLKCHSRPPLTFPVISSHSSQF